MLHWLQSRLGTGDFKSRKSFFLFHTTQFDHKYPSVPLPAVGAARQTMRVQSAPSVIKYKYCTDLTVWWHEDVLGDTRRKFLLFVRDRKRPQLPSPECTANFWRSKSMIFLDESCVYLFLFITVTELYTKEQRAILAAKTHCKTKEGKYQYVIQK